MSGRGTSKNVPAKKMACVRPNEDKEIVIHARIYLLLVNKPLAQLASFVCAMEITLRE